MNNGTISNIVIICIIILIVSGWFENSKYNKILNKKSIIIILLLYFIFINYWISLPFAYIKLNLGGVVLSVTTLYILYNCLNYNNNYLFKIIYTSIFSGSILLFLFETIPLDPTFFIFDIIYIYSILLVLINIIIIKPKVDSIFFIQTISSIILTVIIIDILSAILLSRDNISIIADGYSMDLIFISIIFFIFINIIPSILYSNKHRQV